MRRMIVCAIGLLVAQSVVARTAAAQPRPMLSRIRGGARPDVPSLGPPSPPPTSSQRGETVAMVTAVVVIVGAWLAVATCLYAIREDWPYAQAFFYAVDTGMSIGFGTVAEQRSSTKAFTILHVLLGASAVGGAIALFAEAAISGAAAVAGSEYARASVRAAFARADTDRSGTLSTREFEAVLTKESGLALGPAERQQAIALFDHDQDGSVSIDEFLRLVEPHVDSNTPVAEAVRKVVKARSVHPLVRLVSAAVQLVVAHRVIALWVLWLAAGTLWGMAAEGWGPISGLYFAVGALATGGLDGPGLTPSGTIPDAKAIFVGVYCLTGIPVFAMALGQFANALIQRHVAAREQRALAKPISEDEFEFAQQLVANDGKIDLAEFVVLELYRLGRIDGTTLKAIKAAFAQLDTNNDGWLRKHEVLKHGS